MSTAEGPNEGRERNGNSCLGLLVVVFVAVVAALVLFFVCSFVCSFVRWIVRSLACSLACLCCQENTKSCTFEVVSGFISFSLLAHTLVEKFEQTPLQHDRCTVCGALKHSTRAFRRIVCIILMLCF